MAASIAVVLFYQDGMCLARNGALRRKYLGEGIPIAGVKDAASQVFDFVAEPLEGCSITTAENPGDSSP
jgi:hypothetical protein